MFHDQHLPYLFRNVTFPVRSAHLGDSCKSPFLIIPVILTVTQVDTLPAPVTIPTTTVVPAKRRVQPDARPDLQQSPSSRRPAYPVDAERPTKLQRTSPAAKLVAASSSS